MSKRTSYGKIYRPDIRFVRTSAFTHGHVFTVRAERGGQEGGEGGKNKLRPHGHLSASTNRLRPCRREGGSASVQT
jgi:hypothetical protein